MALLVVIFVVLVASCIAGGVTAHRRHWSAAGGPVAWEDAAARRWGRVCGGLSILVFGCVLAAGVGLALGFLAKNIEPSVDHPVFRYVHSHVTSNLFTSLNEKLTYMGNTPIIEVVCIVSVILLGSAYKRRWWLPVIGVGISFVDEKYIQKLLAKVVDRGHPPTSFGTYPSGGTARVLAVYAAVVLLAMMLLPGLNRAWRAGLWTGLITAGVVEAFTRVYLSKHWFTDALFALPFGTILLLTNVAAISAVSYRSPAAQQVDVHAREESPPEGAAMPSKT